jgi:hypothetical protein
MNRTTVLQMGVGFVLALAGAIMLYASNGGVKTSAQTNTPYSSTWRASKLITVSSSGYWSNVPVQEIPIGIAEWSVAGTVGTKTFTETWSVPSINGTVFDPTTRVTSGAGFTPAKWLFASHVARDGNTPNNGLVTYLVKDVSMLDNAYNSYQYIFGNARVGGNAIRCASNTDSNCLHARGLYGWEVYHALSNIGSERGRISASGAMIPLEWTVSGNIRN